MIFKLKFFCRNEMIKEEEFIYRWSEDLEDIFWPDSEYSRVQIPDGYKYNCMSYDPDNDEVHYYLNEEGET